MITSRAARRAALLCCVLDRIAIFCLENSAIYPHEKPALFCYNTLISGDIGFIWERSESGMYQVGEQVLYGVHGVCTIAEQEERTVDRKKILYYVLEPRDQAGARYYVPAGNPAALAKMRPVMTRQELEALLDSEAVRRDTWIEDENARKQRYRELISSCDRTELICMVRTLHARKKAQAAAGRKFHLCDENFLRDAEKLLNSEFSLVLDIPPAEIAGYVRRIVEGE